MVHVALADSRDPSRSKNTTDEVADEPLPLLKMPAQS